MPHTIWPPSIRALHLSPYPLSRWPQTHQRRDSTRSSIVYFIISTQKRARFLIKILKKIMSSESCILSVRLFYSDLEKNNLMPHELTLRLCRATTLPRSALNRSLAASASSPSQQLAATTSQQPQPTVGTTATVASNLTHRPANALLTGVATATC